MTLDLKYRRLTWWSSCSSFLFSLLAFWWLICLPRVVNQTHLKPQKWVPQPGLVLKHGATYSMTKATSQMTTPYGVSPSCRISSSHIRYSTSIFTSKCWSVWPLDHFCTSKIATAIGVGNVLVQASHQFCTLLAFVKQFYTKTFGLLQEMDKQRIVMTSTKMVIHSQDITITFHVTITWIPKMESTVSLKLMLTLLL